MKKLFILILSADTESRKFCESIENMTFKLVDLKEKISMELDLSSDDISLMEMTDFMDAVNDDNLDLDNSFISYIFIEPKI